MGVSIGYLGGEEGAGVDRHVPICTLFLPIQHNAFMVSLGSPHFSRLRPGFVTSCAVMALSLWPIACSAFHAAWDNDMLLWYDRKDMRWFGGGVGFASTCPSCSYVTAPSGS